MARRGVTPSEAIYWHICEHPSTMSELQLAHADEAPADVRSTVMALIASGHVAYCKVVGSTLYYRAWSP